MTDIQTLWFLFFILMGAVPIWVWISLDRRVSWGTRVLVVAATYCVILSLAVVIGRMSS